MRDLKFNYILIMLFFNVYKFILWCVFFCRSIDWNTSIICACCVAVVSSIRAVLLVCKKLLTYRNHSLQVNRKKEYTTTYHLPNNHGFSLLEILLVMLLVSFFLTSAVPKWHNFCITQQMRVSVAQLRSMFIYARDLAITKQKQVQLCGSSDQQSCDGDWSKYILVRYADEAAVGSVARVSDALPKGWSIRWQSSLGHNSFLIFFPDASFAGQRGSFYVDSPPDADHLERRLVVSLSGHLHVI